MQAMTADQCEEARQERAPRWACPERNHGRELADLDTKKCGPQYEGRGHRAVEPKSIVRPGADACEAAGEAREEKAGRLEPDVAEVEQRLPSRPAGRRVH